MAVGVILFFGCITLGKDENGRKLTDAERFTLALSQIAGKRLTFAEVTGKVDVSPF
jgi:hypothetical protein